MEKFPFFVNLERHPNIYREREINRESSRSRWVDIKDKENSEGSWKSTEENKQSDEEKDR